MSFGYQYRKQFVKKNTALYDFLHTETQRDQKLLNKKNITEKPFKYTKI